MRRTLVIALLLALTAAAAHHVYGPYRLREALAQATANGQPEQLESLIDFGALRESVRMQLDEEEAGNRPARGTTSPRDGINDFLRRSVLEEFTARMGTPSGMLMLFQGRDFMTSSGTRPLPDGVNNAFSAATTRWVSPVRVALEGVGTRNGEGGVSVVLTRAVRGWTVSDLRLEVKK